MMTNIVLGIDLGSIRVGLAIGRTDTGIAFPFQTLTRNENTADEIAKIVSQEHVTDIVLGLPRNLSGDDTDQTKQSREFAKELETATNLPITLQDEALTSVNAEERLKQSGRQYKKEEVDAMAACILTEDYLRQKEKV